MMDTEETVIVKLRLQYVPFQFQRFNTKTIFEGRIHFRCREMKLSQPYLRPLETSNTNAGLLKHVNHVGVLSGLYGHRAPSRQD